MNQFTRMIGLLLLTVGGSAQAGVIQVGGTGGGVNGEVSAKAGVCTVDFNSGTAVNSCGATYSEGGGALSASHFHAGTTAGVAAAPRGDTSVYISVGPTDGSPIRIDLATPADYFGFYGGSLDAFNAVQFFLDGRLIDSFTGTDINAVAFPSTVPDGGRAVYIDYFPSSLYNSIVYSSGGNAFETDNHAFGLATPTAIPEPMTGALIGIGSLSLLAIRRRKT